MVSSLDKAIATARKERTKRLRQVGLRPEQKEDVKAAFELFDQDGSGSIDEPELRTAMKAVGLNVSKAQATMMIAEIDTDGGGTVNLEEFTQLVTRQFTVADPAESVEEAFQLFLKRGPPEGKTITLAHLEAICVESGEKIGAEVLQAMIKLADTDESGDVSSEEFKALIKKTGVFHH